MLYYTMLYEYECKIINIPITELRNKIEKNGGKRIHSSVLFRRYLFHLPNKNQNGFIRLRSEGRNRVTLTCKIFNSNSKYPKEDEIELKGDFDDAYHFLLNCGLKQKSYIETKREKWRHPLVKEIVIDHWPGLEPYMEIDCESEKNLQKAIKIFDINKKNVFYEGVHELYKNKYKISKNNFINLPKLDFTNFKKQLRSNSNHTLKNKIEKKLKNNKTRKNNGNKSAKKVSSRKTRKRTK